MSTRSRSAALALVPALLWAGCGDPSQPLAPETSFAAGGAHAVQVAPPAGDPAQDRAAIQAALAAVQPGGTVQFASGTYEVGAGAPSAILVLTPRITLLGHPDGTMLHGCDPVDVGFGDCEGLLLAGGHQTVRGIEFVGMSSALILIPGEGGAGGYRVENNAIRNVWEGVSLVGELAQPAVVRDNTFINAGVAVALLGSPLHAIDNYIAAPEPALVPIDGAAFAGIWAFAWDLLGLGPCDGNIVARNWIGGYPTGIGFEMVEGQTCSHNVIRDNTIIADGVFEGFFLPALFVWNYSGQADLVEHNLFRGNRVLSATGAGVAIFGASNTRVVGNVIQDVAPSPWGAWVGVGNGSGVWVSPGSSANRILANTFGDVATYAVVVEGDGNHVATIRASDSVLDLGTGNRVTGPATIANLSAAATSIVASEAIEHVEVLRRTGAAMVRLQRGLDRDR
jgi:hypothetical protein